MTTDEQIRRDIGRLSRSAKTAFDQGNYEQCVTFYQEAYRKSTQLDENTEKLCTLNYGAALVNRGKFKFSDERQKDEGVSDLNKGVEVLNKVAPVNASLLHHDIHGDVLFNMGYAYDLLHDYRKAVEFYIKAQVEYKKDRKGDMELKCLERCLSLHQENKQFTDAAKVCKDMSKVHKSDNKVLKEAYCLCQSMLQLMKNEVEREKTSEMATKCKVCLYKLEKISGADCLEAAKIYNEVGLVEIQLQNFEEGTRCFEQALEHLRNSGTTILQLEAVFLQNLGAAYNFLGQYDQAIANQKIAVEKYGNLNSRRGQAQCFMNCAFACSQLGKVNPGSLEQSDLYYHHALQAAEDAKDAYMKWQIYEGLGAISCQRGRISDAKEYLKHALFYVGNKDAAVHTRILEKYDLMRAMEMRKERPGLTSLTKSYRPFTNGKIMVEMKVPQNVRNISAVPSSSQTILKMPFTSQQMADTPREMTTSGQQMNNEMSKFIPDFLVISRSTYFPTDDVEEITATL